MADLETKTLALELKADSDGAFSATFATLNVIDHHGDVTRPGAFESGKEVLIGGYQHDMMALPVGKGTIHANDERAWVEGSFFTDTQHGKDTYATVKAAGGLMEWSYIFKTLESEEGDFEADGKTMPVRFLKKLDVWSVDPVLKGAGIGTRTDSIKSLQPFADEADAVLAAAEAFAKRAGSLAELRAKEGRMMSAANMERLKKVHAAMQGALADMERLMADMNPPKGIDLDAEYLKFQHATALLAGAI